MVRSMGFAALLAASSALVLPVTDPAHVQGETPTPRVTLTQSAGPPGGNVSVPIQLSGVESASLGTLTLRLVFTAARLTFSKVEIGGVGEAAGVEVATETQHRSPETLLDVTITTRAQDGVRAPLPDGPIAQLLFRIGKDLKPETVIRLKLQASGTAQRGGTGPVKVVARDGEIVVSNPPVIGCFFYMH